MKHLIIGSGTIGLATGTLLEAHNQSVTYNDKDANLILDLNKQNKQVDFNIRHEYDLYWICTSEWHVENVLNTLKSKPHNIVIRSTIKPHELNIYHTKYSNLSLAHIPEFLRQKTAIADIFNTRHFVIGVNDISLKTLLTKLFNSLNINYTICKPEESSLIKLIANSWLALQISFWNEIKSLCSSYHVNPQLIANTITLDPRISSYGSHLLGQPFSGFCFPKDTKSLAETFKSQGIPENLITALIKTNEALK